MVVSNRNILFQGPIFRGYVNFREGIWWLFTYCRSLHRSQKNGTEDDSTYMSPWCLEGRESQRASNPRFRSDVSSEDKSHRSHGIGIFTYTLAWIFCGKSIGKSMIVPWILWGWPSVGGTKHRPLYGSLGFVCWLRWLGYSGCPPWFGRVGNPCIYLGKLTHPTKREKKNHRLKSTFGRAFVSFQEGVRILVS